MSYMFVMGNCCNCGGLFSFHPDFVPSLRVKGEKQPVCGTCIAGANEQRVEMGMPPFEVHSEAYEPKVVE